MTDAEHRPVKLVILPLYCLVEAAANLVSTQEWLEVLIGHPATVLLGEHEANWQILSSLRGLLGSTDLASAALFALDSGADVLTRQPDLHEKLGGGGMTIGFDD
jgi:hypothetical protein